MIASTVKNTNENVSLHHEVLGAIQLSFHDLSWYFCCYSPNLWVFEILL